ncbi:hypothetical protein NPIL_499451 [Nephila pilipes]|uniref:Uncharacterized protein n=1 Tax=Nephila pilipes TaxID=299642 RepID=A0A8X6M8H6_NEPPI|nr:hypothetical protein NPIL_499451 [Nephila pilipes]
MHWTIKYVYLQEKKVKRLDRALFYLMKFVRDRVFDRLICLEKGKISSQIAQLRKRHKVGQELTSFCIRKNEEEWSVASTKVDEEMVICEDRKFLEKATLVDNLKATATRKKSSKEEFQKKCMELTNKINKTPPVQYDNVSSLLQNTLDSPHFFPSSKSRSCTEKFE